MFQQILKADWIINNLYLKIIYYHIPPLVTCIRLGTFLLENKLVTKQITKQITEQITEQTQKSMI